MTTSDILAAQSVERWWIASPCEDESLRSIVERAQRLYGGEADGLRDRLKVRATARDASESQLDVLSARELCLFARTIGVPASSLFPHRLPDHPLLLKETQRRAFCPMCWHEDLTAGLPTTFRRAWAGVFTLNCSTHGLPLHWASPLMEFDAESARSVPKAPSSPQGRRVLRFIEIFARLLEDALRGQAAWPALWRGDPYTVRALLMRTVVNLGCVLEHPPFASVSAAPDLAAFIGRPNHRIAPLQESPWEHVRALGPPAWRRAALWMTTRYVLPAPKPGYRPEGLPVEAFAALDAQWNALPEGYRQLRRARRYRTALRSMCRPFPAGRGG
jgi:hypothetical protein